MHFDNFELERQGTWGTIRADAISDPSAYFMVDPETRSFPFGITPAVDSEGRALAQIGKSFPEEQDPMAILEELESGKRNFHEAVFENSSFLTGAYVLASGVELRFILSYSDGDEARVGRRFYQGAKLLELASRNF